MSATSEKAVLFIRLGIFENSSFHKRPTRSTTFASVKWPGLLSVDWNALFATSNSSFFLSDKEALDQAWMPFIVLTGITTSRSFRLHLLSSLVFLFQHLEQWPKHMPLVCHAEGRTTAAILLLAELADRPVHIAHVARKEEVRKLTEL